jgi:NAD(P)-dependent dehydrogenase (short-subunit alcohol dehydrogenase family)
MMLDPDQYGKSSLLHDKVVIITGAGSGIGRATAMMAAAAGAHVIAADIAGAERTVADIETAGGRAAAGALDVSSRDQWTDLVEKTITEHGRINCLGNIAGIAGPLDSVVTQTDKGWDRILNVNLKGPWLGMQAVIPHMLEAGGGRIVNMASTAGITALPGSLTYAASKGGLIAMSRQVAVEFAAQGIRVNTVAPGIVETPIIGDAPAESIDMMKAATPVKRLGKPSEIAAMVCYLFGSAADFLTGQTLVVDGGWTAQ